MCASAGELGKPDLVILPGTKNTMGDLQLAAAERPGSRPSRSWRPRATPVMGICGGYQMLGRTLQTRMGWSRAAGWRGMGLLPVDTVFEPQKVRTRVQGQVLARQRLFRPPEGCPVRRV